MANTVPLRKTVEDLRTPPHSTEAEQSVMGGLLLDPRAFDRVADMLREDDFYHRHHRLIFRAVVDMVEDKKEIDAVTVAEWLESRDLLEKVGGGAYITGLAKDTPSAANIGGYAEIVQEKSALRSLVDIGGQISSMAFEAKGRPSKDLVEQAEKLIFELAERGSGRRGAYEPLKATLTAAFDRLEKLYKNKKTVTGVASGFTDFDELTAGLQPSDLIVVAGRPAMGKTSFATNIAQYAALKEQVPVALFSMEMSAVQIVLRLISSLGGVNQSRLRTGDLDDQDWSWVASSITLMSEANNIFIDETPALGPLQLASRARRLKREHDIGLIVVDYLQLMEVPGGSENRATEISTISRSLKSLAKELNIPVIALSQLNRAVEQRPSKRPIMADLRDSGAVEQDADLIVFIYRDEVYHEDSEDKGKAEIIIGKHRNGATGTIKLAFQGQYTRFKDLAMDIYSD